MKVVRAAAALLCCLQVARAQLEEYIDAVEYTPITIPLAVRGPYNGAYLKGRQDKNLAKMNPSFWTGTPLGWRGLARIDGEVWNWMGDETQWPAMRNFSVTTDSYSSVFVFNNGDDRAAPTVSLTASFISPITPDDRIRQSLPFSYLNIEVASLNGEPHDIEVYTDVNGLWTSDDEAEQLEWDIEKQQGFTAHHFRLLDQRPFHEDADRILHGDVWYGTKSSSGVKTTYSSGHDLSVTRRLFAASGQLTNSVNSTFRPTHSHAGNNSSDEPVFAFAHAFSAVETTASTLLAIGLVRDPIVQYMTANETIFPLRPLWASRFKSVSEAFAWFLDDFEVASLKSAKFNQKLYQDARRMHSKTYGDVLAVSTRQIFMALEHVWDEISPIDESTRYRPIPLTMLKEVSSNGNCQTMDVIAPALPFLLYAAPSLLASLLEPGYRYVATKQYLPLPPPHDLGQHYPNATGRNDFLYPDLPLEEAGNALNLAYAGLVMGAEGREQAERYYPLLRQWATYLQEETLYPGGQRSTDDFFPEAANQTSLAVKGIIGLQSMAEIAKQLGEYDDYRHFSAIAQNYRDEFMTLGVAKDSTHMLGSYFDQDSWVTEYNLFYDILLDTKLFPEWVYDMQDEFYLKQDLGYGPPLDSRNPTRSKTDWLAWTAASSSRREVQDMLINALDRYFRQDRNSDFGDLITPDEGWSVGFLTRPVVGGHFALLALDTMRERRRELAKWYRPYVPKVPSVAEVKEHVQDATKVAKGHPVLSTVTLGFLALVGGWLCARSSAVRRRRGVDYHPLKDMSQ